MSYYLYGFIEAKEPKNFGPIGFELEANKKEDVVAQTGKHLAAVIGPAPFDNFGGLSKERLIKALLTHQETLETIMKTQFILPCKFGTIFRTEGEVLETLSQNEPVVTEWLNKMKNRCELEVVATWDLKQTLQEIAQSDPVTQELAKQEEEKLSLGVRLVEKLKERASDYAQDILNALKEKSESYATHDVMNDEMVFNASFLLARSGEALFFKTLEDLDKHLEGKLHFKCIGPLPPYSFATVTIQRFDQDKIRRAEKQLDLGGEMDIVKIKQAYKTKARQCHPDTHPEFDKKQFEALNQAYELLADYYEGGCKLRKVSLLNVNGAMK